MDRRWCARCQDAGMDFEIAHGGAIVGVCFSCLREHVRAIPPGSPLAYQCQFALRDLLPAPLYARLRAEFPSVMTQ